MSVVPSIMPVFPTSSLKSVLCSSTVHSICLICSSYVKADPTLSTSLKESLKVVKKFLIVGATKFLLLASWFAL